MSATGATVQGESYVYGRVLFQRVTEPESRQHLGHVGLGTCLAQGLTTSAVITFLLMVVRLLADSQNGYNFLIISFFPLILCYGLLPGFIEGPIIGICTIVAGHNLRWFTRIIIAALVFLIPVGSLLFLLTGGVLSSELFVALGICGAIGALYGLLTGSSLSPWRELVRGDHSLPVGSWFLTGLTGLLLRLSVAFFFMEAIFYLIVKLQQSEEDALLWSLALVLHFAFAFAIVFARLSFRFLLPLALMIVVSIVLTLNYLMKNGIDFFVYLGIGYLVLWAAFLITRYAPTYRVFHFLKEEVHYYLID